MILLSHVLWIFLNPSCLPKCSKHCLPEYFWRKLQNQILYIHSFTNSCWPESGPVCRNGSELISQMRKDHSFWFDQIGMISVCWLDSLGGILIVCLDECLKSETWNSKVTCTYKKANTKCQKKKKKTPRYNKQRKLATFGMRRLACLWRAFTTC